MGTTELWAEHDTGDYGSVSIQGIHTFLWCLVMGGSEAKGGLVCQFRQTWPEIA